MVIKNMENARAQDFLSFPKKQVCILYLGKAITKSFCYVHVHVLRFENISSAARCLVRAALSCGFFCRYPSTPHDSCCFKKALFAARERKKIICECTRILTYLEPVCTWFHYIIWLD